MISQPRRLQHRTYSRKIPILDLQINEFTPRAESDTSSAYLLVLLLAFYFVFVTRRLRK